MKHILALVTSMIMAMCLQAQGLLPASVQQFLNDYQYCKRIDKLGVNAGMREHSIYYPAKVIDGHEMVDAFIAIDNDAVISLLEAQGVIVGSRFDGFVTAQIPVDNLAPVSRLTGVKDIEISRQLTLTTDSTRRVTHVTQVQQGIPGEWAKGFDGTGVIVGVIDTGFDYQHRAFRSNDDVSHSRIVRVYSTTDNSGHRASYNRGTIKLPGSVFMNDEIYSLTTDNKNGTHGTHTTSIAAGSHVNGYGGMAPGADIVLCAASALDGSLSEVEIANCVRYIDSYADSVGKPCVISVSVSTNAGPHDGSDYLSKAIKQITGPGRIFVIAAGNNKGKNFYASKLSSPSNPLNLIFKGRNYINADSTYLYRSHISEIWMRSTNTNLYYKFHILDKTTGKIVWESEQFSGKVSLTHHDLRGFYDCYTDADTVGTITATPSYASANKKYYLSISIHNLICHEYTISGGQKISRYALGVSVYPRKNTPVYIDAWAGINGTGYSDYPQPVTTPSGEVNTHFYSSASDACCIGTYATSDSVISAGAFTARNTYFSMSNNKIVTDNTESVGRIASFSSYQLQGHGPTGEALPTTCAPGVDVVGACSKYSYFAYTSNPTTVMTVDGSWWGVMTGTSMAAPTVAGIIALWLQADPNLSVAEVKSILTKTGIHDRYTEGLNAFEYGPNGKIDALAGMRLVLNRMGFLLGDIDNDQQVTINDLSTLIDHLLSGDLKDLNLMNADLDGNGIITIDDLSYLIDFLLKY
ncbi:MAG: S8 family serine peptidase [Muribaculaceae bacterium]|nr:S8 family serine peptidase [Muribaculaceae bacterium]